MAKYLKTKIEISARHIHLNQKDLENLFGKDYKLKVRKKLSQTGQYASVDKVNVKYKNNNLSTRVLGPVRPYSQIEISKTDAIKLGVKALLRVSGDIKGVPKLEVVGPAGKVKIPVIIAKRHLHCPVNIAKKYNLRKNQKLSLEIKGERGVIFNNIIVRIHEKFTLSCHLDTDEGNAVGVNHGDYGKLILKK